MDVERFKAGIKNLTITMKHDQEYLWDQMMEPKRMNWRTFVQDFADNNRAAFPFIVNDESEYAQDLEEFVDLLEGNGYTLTFNYNRGLKSGTVEVAPIHE